MIFKIAIDFISSKNIKMSVKYNASEFQNKSEFHNNGNKTVQQKSTNSIPKNSNQSTT